MASITIKLSPEESRRIRAEAHRARRTLSAHVRAALFPDADRRRVRLTRDPKTGLPTFQVPPGTPPITTADVKALLADFP